MHEVPKTRRGLRARRPGLRAATVIPTAAALAGAFALAGPVASAAAATSSVAGTHPQWAAALADRGAVAAGSQVGTTVYLAGRDEAGLNAYAAAVSDPGNALYHRYLTPQQFDARFGATSAQVSAVESWLRGAGLTVTAAGEHSITATGTAAATERAYGTKLDEYSVKGKIYRAPTADARIPGAVAGAVLTVTGLDDAPTEMKPAGLVGEETTPSVPGLSATKAKQSVGSDGSVFLGPTPCSSYFGQIKDTTDPAFKGKKNLTYDICGYVPSQIRGAYGVAASGLTGRGVTVAIVDAYGSPTMLADADSYAVNHGDQPFSSGQYTETVTPAQWTDQDECGGPAGWAGEESLDVESVHGIAPDANVHYYGADSCMDSDFLSVFTSIVDTHSADIVSDSWGGVVYSTSGDEDPAVIAEYTQVFEQGAIEGIGFNFSAGDCGAEDPATFCGSDDTSTTPQADFPDSDPYATSVGGTSVAIGAQNQSEWATVWGTDAWVLDADNTTWDAFGWQFGGGGGTSAVFAQPWYQQGVASRKVSETLPDGSTVSSRMRVTPDVSMDADPETGVLVGMTQELPDGTTGYAESDIGGTSLACPLFAGLQADAIQAQHGVATGFENPAIYASAGTAAFSDVTGTGVGVKTYVTLPESDGFPPAVLNFGDDALLKATKGFDDATGVGTPSPSYLTLHSF
jgi:subtilase family serine protease